MAFEFETKRKFALLAIDGLYANLPELEFQLPDGTWVMPSLPRVADLSIWKQWIGSLRADSLQCANLVLVAQKASHNPMVLDEAHNQLANHLSGLFYSLHLRSGMERVGENEPDLLCGSRLVGDPIIRQMRRLSSFHQTMGYRRTPMTREWLEEASTLYSGTAIMASVPGYFMRVFRGLNVLFRGMKETGQERMHHFVRALEALILPGIGNTRRQFVHRCQTFALACDAARTALAEAFDMRSDTEHLQDWNRAVLTHPVSVREHVCWQRTRQIEHLAPGYSGDVMIFVGVVSSGKSMASRDHTCQQRKN